METKHPEPAGSAAQAVFAAAVPPLMRRVVLRRFLAWLVRRGWLAALAVLGLALLWALGGGGMRAFWAALAVLTLGAAGLLALIWRARPSIYAAWALWDRAAGRREAFAAAWWYETQPQRTAAEAAHWQAQAAQLAAARERLSKDLPLPRLGRLLWVACGTLLTGAVCLWVEVSGREPVLTAAMVESAKTESERLRALQVDAEKLAMLSEEERNRLNAQIKEAAAELEQSAGKSAREVLNALEAKAREAEKLAERLGAQDEAWASAELTEALRNQADTADLGDAVAGRRAAAAAAEAENLAQKLESAAAEQQERLQEVFAAASEAATQEDAQRPVGRGVEGAARGLQASQPTEAAAAMRELAESFRQTDGRRQAAEELQNLAQQLREAGSQVANAEAPGAAMQALQEQDGQAQQGQRQAAQTGQSGDPNQSGQMSTQTAAAGQEGGESQPSSAGQAQAPPAGAQGPQLSLSQGGAPAGQDGKPPEGAPRLLAPVPGQNPGDKPPEMAVIMPGAGGGATMQGAASGLPPGSGSSDPKGEETERLEGAQSALARANPSGEGASTLRQVEGGAPREEAAGMGASALSVEFLAAQEAALDEAALPAARREQVRRYFNALRKRLEGGR